MKKVLLGLLIIFVLVAAGGYIFLSTGKKVNVKWDEVDYNSAIEKSSVTVADIEELNLVTLARGDFTTTGTDRKSTRLNSSHH